MTDSFSQHCPNCEAQVNTIEELRAANERWVISFKLAEERANERIEAHKQEVSEALLEWFDGTPPSVFDHFITPKPTVDPLVEVIEDAAKLRAALQETGQ